jgi:SOS-response transcriptional repressor LexA
MKLDFNQTLNALCQSVGPAFRKTNGTVNITALAHAMRMDQPTLNRMVAGKTKDPAGASAEKLCRFFGVSRDQLLGNSPIPSIEVNNWAILNETAEDSARPEPKRRVLGGKVPLISLDGAGSWVEDLDPYEMPDVEDWIDWPSKTTRNAFAVRQTGSSMFNSRTGEGYPGGCILKIEPESSSPAVNGSDVIVKMKDGAVIFKQLQIDGNSKFLSAINPDWPDRIIKMPESSVICGVCDGYFMDTKR